MKIETYGQPLNNLLKNFDTTFDERYKLNNMDISRILYWLHVHNNEVDMNEQDTVVFKKLMKMIPDTSQKVVEIFNMNHKLNSQD